MRYCLLALMLSACVKDPVDWGDVSYRQSQPGDPDTRSAVCNANRTVVGGTGGGGEVGQGSGFLHDGSKLVGRPVHALLSGQAS